MEGAPASVSGSRTGWGPVNKRRLTGGGLSPRFPAPGEADRPSFRRAGPLSHVTAAATARFRVGFRTTQSHHGRGVCDRYRL